MKVGDLHWRSPNLTGQTFGCLTAIRPSHSDGKRQYWVYQCVCGAEVTRVGSEVARLANRERIQSCGCQHGRATTKHGLSFHPAYAVYRNMLDRCRLPSHKAWKNYGGRGITVCARWQESFENFWADMKETYQPGLTLDRKDNSLGYSPENCRWVTYKTQALNRRGNIGLDLKALSLETGIPRSTLYYRYRNGLSLTSPTAARGTGSSSSETPDRS